MPLLRWAQYVKCRRKGAAGLLKELPIIHLDFESRSKADIWEVGAWAYSAHPSTEILCMAYAIDEGPVKIITRDEFLTYQNLGWSCEDLFEAIQAGMPIAAYNAFFEQCIWQNIMVPFYGRPRVPIKQWRCVMAKARARSLPGSLANCCKALKTDHQKDEAGKRTMMKLAKPNAKGEWNEDPEDFEKLYQYCGDDVAAERAVDHAIPDLTPTEQTIWFLDQHINQRGICIDLNAVQKALQVISDHTATLNADVLSASEGRLDGVTRRMAVLQWCQEQGVAIEGYTKEDVKAALAQPNLPESVRIVLEAKSQLGKTSTAKYKAMQNAVTEDGKIRDTLLYHGANTGRWAGKLIQLQNLPKGNVEDTDQAVQILKHGDFELMYPDVMGTLSSCIRGMIVASPGNDLIVADYGAIEARVVMWLAGEERGLKQFRAGGDMYVEMARTIYGSNTITKAQRQLGKAAILGCGYGMGAPKFNVTCASWGIPVTEELAQKAVDTYRQSYSRVRDSWYSQERGAIEAVQTGKSVVCGKVRWSMEGTSLVCILPSGRSIVYNEATLEYNETNWGERKIAIQFSHVDTKNQWSRSFTYGGKLVENITQAVARDLLAAAMLRLEKESYPVIFSVHDEIVSDVPKGFGSVEEYVEIMCNNPRWAADCPIVAEGFRCQRYKK